jgi:RecA-family ATPase
MTESGPPTNTPPTSASKSKICKQNTSMWFDTDPRTFSRDEIIPGFTVGTVGSFVAPGGTGKSFLALELALAVASPLADVAGFMPPRQGKTLYLNAEDPQVETGLRLAWLGERLSPEAKKAVDENFFMGSAYGSLIDLGKKPDGNNSDKSDIEQLANDFCNYRLIILDTLTRFHSLDENNNGQMAVLISHLEHLARETGAAVLFLHHTNKASIRGGDLDSQAASRGANVLTANIRYSAYLVKMTETEANGYGIAKDRRNFYLRFGVAKQNYGLPQKDRWLERREGGVLVPVELLPERIKTNKMPRKIFNSNKIAYKE